VQLSLRTGYLAANLPAAAVSQLFVLNSNRHEHEIRGKHKP
jgi:hypothetical protein